jgi:acetyltransferase-like isoleucine patch superfamily enzyme
MTFRVLREFKRLFYIFIAKIAGNNYRVNYLRKQGVKIGTDCLIFSTNFSTEPYLIKIGDHVVIGPSVTLITHDGSIWIFRDRFPDITVFGKIIVGNNSFIGSHSMILPNTEIGSNCIIGAGSVVRGKIPDNSVVMGNPGKVVMKVDIAEKFLLNSKDRIDTKHMSERERKLALIKYYNL